MHKLGMLLLGFVAGMAGGICGTMISLKQTEARNTLIVENCLLRNSNGNYVAEINAGGDGSGPTLHFDSPLGTLSMGYRSYSPGMDLCDETGALRALIYLNGQGCPSLELRDIHENPRLRIGLSENGDPSIQMYNAQGEVIWRAP